MRSNKSPHQNELIARALDGAVARLDEFDPLIVRSWRRSVEGYRIDPGRVRAPRVLTGAALRQHREPAEPLLAQSRETLIRAHQQLSTAGYVLMLADACGVTIEFLSQHGALLEGGLGLGSCWDEPGEGTNAIGACIVEKAPVTVHRAEHFLESHRIVTCTAAPIFGPRGDLVAVLNATSLDVSGERKDKFLAQQFIAGTAHIIETTAFFSEFQKCWILKLNEHAGLLETTTESLLAINAEGRVIGANRVAFCELAGCGLSMLLGRAVRDLFDIDFEDLLATTPAQTGHGLLVHAGPDRRPYFALLRWPKNIAARQNFHQGERSPQKTLVKKIDRANFPELESLAGDDPAMLRNIQTAKRVVDRPISILLRGETGVGKELFARALHGASRRAGEQFVALNCAAIPESLIESELFGYGDGAFTGARKKGMKGKILQSSGGTLFLDEIGDMPLDLQTRLLRVLAQNEVHPLGLEQAIAVDLHVICATHRDIRELVASGKFREDLYFRLAAMTFELPALRQRADRRALIESVLRQESLSENDAMAFDDSAMKILLAFDWPGNIRQLQNTIRYCLAVVDSPIITAKDLPPEVFETTEKSPSPVDDRPLNARQKVGRESLIAALKANRWEIAASARALGVARITLYRNILRFGIILPKHSDRY
jgi:sigma-54 dependent transcriptional regulator, acetoin dehydrogenase operon transcriptional activator AcoR